MQVELLGATRSVYPGGRVSIADRAEARRSSETWRCTCVTAVTGRRRVEVVGEPLDRHDTVRVQEQDRERRALLRPAEPNRAVLADDLERPQDAELEHRADGSRSVAAR